MAMTTTAEGVTETDTSPTVGKVGKVLRLIGKTKEILRVIMQSLQSCSTICCSAEREVEEFREYCRRVRLNGGEDMNISHYPELSNRELYAMHACASGPPSMTSTTTAAITIPSLTREAGKRKMYGPPPVYYGSAVLDRVDENKETKPEGEEDEEARRVEARVLDALVGGGIYV